ncbi:hypothetical protein ACH4TV_18930 [Streptomyces sp. NPDC020898]|uniref:hypothetical protein n=1 Tax=Streptomyces sp. NPDC020898 TaxID=3365101 RepID=UPI00379BF7EB
MTQPHTIVEERLTPRIRKITFCGPPVNPLVPETIARLHEVIPEAALRSGS